MRQLLPRADEALLDRVVGAVHIPQDAVRQRVETVERDRGERLECVMVPASRPLHELVLHLGHPLPTTGGRLHRY